MNACVTAASSKAGGIRFAEANSAAAAAAHSHVHFDEKLHDSVVMVIPESDGNFLVKVSFGQWFCFICIHIYKPTHAHTLYLSIHNYVYTYMHMYVNTSIHTYIHTYIYNASLCVCINICIALQIFVSVYWDLSL